MTGVLVLLSASTAYGGAFLLAIAGGGQLRHQRRLRRILRAQGILPRRLHGVVAGVVTPVELATAATVLTLMTAAPRTAMPVLVAQAAVFAAFAVYLSVVRARVPAAPCGCFGGAEPVTRRSVARAALFGAGTAATVPLLPVLAAAPPATRVVVVGGGLVAAMAGWLLSRLSRSPVR